MDAATLQDIPALLLKWREQEGISQRLAGERIGVTAEAIANYERGRRFPCGRVVAKIIEEFSCGVPNDR